MQEGVTGFAESRVELFPRNPPFGGRKLVDLGHTDLDAYEPEPQDGGGLLELAERIVPFAPKHDHAARSRQGLVEELKLLGHQFAGHDVHAGHVSEWSEWAVPLGPQRPVERARHNWCRPRRNHEAGAR